MTTNGTTSHYGRARRALAAVTLAVALLATACIQEGTKSSDDALELCVCAETLAVLNAAKWAGNSTTFTTGGDSVRGGGPKYQTWIIGRVQLNGRDAVARANELRQLLGGSGYVEDFVGPPTISGFLITSRQKNPEWSFSITGSNQNKDFDDTLLVQTWSRKEADADFAATLRQILRPILD